MRHAAAGSPLADRRSARPLLLLAHVQEQLTSTTRLDYTTSTHPVSYFSTDIHPAALNQRYHSIVGTSLLLSPWTSRVMVHTRLLVHAGARSGLRDDEQFIFQAEAYADLDSNRALRRHPGTSRQPLDRLKDHIYAQEQSSISHRASPQKQAASQPLRVFDIQVAHAITYVEDTQLAYTALESQLPTPSRISCTKTPRKTAVHEATLGATTHTIDYAIPTPCKVTPARCAIPPFVTETAPRSSRSYSWPGNAPWSQSSYLISPALARSSKRKRLNENPSSTSQQRHATTPATARSALRFPSPAKRRKSTQGVVGRDKISGANGNSSELPTSYSVSDEAGSLRRRARTSQRSASDPGPQSLNFRGRVPQNAASQRENTSPIKYGATLKQTHQVAGIEAVHAPTSATERDETTAHSHKPVDMHSLPAAIFPPTAAVGQQFGTHVTPALQRLIAGDIAKCFKPTLEIRAIDNLERGHWRMQMPSWPSEQLAAFWRNLEHYIAGGNAGWGVWCTREPDTCFRSNSERTEERHGRPAECCGTEVSTGHSTIRVYCWGEVVQHVYLLLYVASNSKVRKSGLQWLDSQGTVVVQMPTNGSTRSK